MAAASRTAETVTPPITGEGSEDVERAERPGVPAAGSTTAATTSRPMVRLAARSLTTRTTGRPHRVSAPGSATSVAAAAPVSVNPSSAATSPATPSPAAVRSNRTPGAAADAAGSGAMDPG